MPKTLPSLLLIAACLFLPAAATAPIKRLPKVGILPTAPCELYTAEVGAKVFTDRDAIIESIAPQIARLNAVRTPWQNAKVELDSRAPVQLLLGIFHSDNPDFARPPSPVPTITNAATVSGMPPIDIYLSPFEKGKRILPTKGTYLILGVIPAGVAITAYDAKGGAK
ncbi:MAG TPA: hypothetical protein VGN88_02290 [Phycisphaerae bacterium]|jgi:hypothetical protein